MAVKKILKDFIFFINRNPVSKYLYNKEISLRSKMNLTDIYQLSKHIQVFSPFTMEINPANDWYGHASIFKKYLGLPQSYQFKFIIEHGTFPTEQVSEVELEPKLPVFLTYSNYRVDILKKYRDHAFSIGPFIHYAPTFYSKDKITSEKKRLGKNLLIFPAHSLSYVINDYDQKWFIKKINKLAKDFDSVRVCLFWADILLGLHKYYSDLGFECVTAGHILDPNFLPRLKTIIEISDLTISNDVGTHVGYSVYLDKPHIIFHKVPEVKGTKKWTNIQSDYWSSTPYLKLLKEFSKVSYNITPTQHKVANQYYGGKNNIKTKAYLLRIVDFAESIYSDNKP